MGEIIELDFSLKFLELPFIVEVEFQRGNKIGERRKKCEARDCTELVCENDYYYNFRAIKRLYFGGAEVTDKKIINHIQSDYLWIKRFESEARWRMNVWDLLEEEDELGLEFPNGIFPLHRQMFLCDDCRSKYLKIAKRAIAEANRKLESLGVKQAELFPEEEEN